MSKEVILKAAFDAIIEGNKEAAEKVLADAKAENLDLMELLAQGFSAGMRELGDLFGRGEVFLPELIFAADIMKAMQTDIESGMDQADVVKKGVIVIGTVAGDVHDIGKGIVCSLIKTNGFEVHDIGREQPARAFIDKAEEVKADYIGSSALLTTTMTEQKKLEDLLRKEGLRDKYKTLVGGAPVTKRWAEKIQADAYCEDAADAVKFLLEWSANK